MERPNDITEWAWEKAEAVVKDIDTDWSGDGGRIDGGQRERHDAVCDIARALFAAVEEEREACAQECDKESDKWHRYDPHNSAYAAAKAIRARSNNKEQTP